MKNLDSICKEIVTARALLHEAKIELLKASGHQAEFLALERIEIRENNLDLAVEALCNFYKE